MTALALRTVLNNLSLFLRPRTSPTYPSGTQGQLSKDRLFSLCFMLTGRGNSTSRTLCYPLLSLLRPVARQALQENSV